jgi:AraC-like DNA-binding protein
MDPVAERAHLVGRVRQLAGDMRSAPSVHPFEKGTVAVLLSVVASPSTPLVAFLTGCRAVRVATRGDAHLMAFLSELDDLIGSFDRRVSHEGLRQVIEDDHNFPDTRMLATRDLAVRWRMKDREVSRITTNELGVGVSGLRMAVRCRPAFVRVFTTKERISQIAYASGYEHVSQLDHDFDRLLGRTPRALRELVRPCLAR